MRVDMRPKGLRTDRSMLNNRNQVGEERPRKRSNGEARLHGKRSGERPHAGVHKDDSRRGGEASGISWGGGGGGGFLGGINAGRGSQTERRGPDKPGGLLLGNPTWGKRVNKQLDRLPGLPKQSDQ